MENEELLILKQLAAWGIELVVINNKIVYINEGNNYTNENSDLNKSTLFNQENTKK